MAMSSKRHIEKNSWVQSFEVSHPVKHKKGFTVYKVVSTVFPKPYPEGVTKLTVWKRFNDFKKLYKELSLIHKQLYLSGEFPKFPKSKFLGRFDHEVVEERKTSALDLLDFSAKHPQLYTSKVFVNFFESGYQIDDLNGSEDLSISNVDDIGKQIESNCLIPERVWEPPNKATTETELEIDRVSINSISSSSPDAQTFTDSDSILSGSILSLCSETCVPPPTSTSSTILPSTPDCGMTKSATTSALSKTTQENFFSGITSSPSLTEDLTSSLQELPANSNASWMVSNSMSCSSLNSTYMSSAKAIRSSTDSLNKKKVNSFSFFDFLPIFPKKVEQNKVKEDKLLADSLNAPYICEAAGHFAVAHHHESMSEFSSAFDSYREGIRILLEGAKGDDDQKRRALVRNKLDKYLLRAESLQAHCSVANVEGSKVQANTNTYAEDLRSLVKSNSSSTTKETVKTLIEASNITELQKYKVVGFAPNRILVVVNMNDKHPRCFAVKVLAKTPCCLEPEKPTIIPNAVPFMVNLIQWYDTENSIILLMHYAGGGKLIDFVKSYQTKNIAIISHDCSPTTDEGIYEASFPMNGRNSRQKNQDTILVGDTLSQIRSDNPKLELPNNKDELLEDGERKSKENARKSNLESESKSRISSESARKEGCPSLLYVYDGKTETRVDEDVETVHHYEPHIKLPINCQNSTENDSFGEFESVTSRKYVCDVEPRDNNASLSNLFDSLLEINSELPLSCPSMMKENNITLSETVFVPKSQETCMNVELVDTHELIESSKVLIQTVSTTLEEGRENNVSAYSQNQEIHDDLKCLEATPTQFTSSSSNIVLSYNLEETLPQNGVQNISGVNISCDETVSNNVNSNSMGSDYYAASSVVANKRPKDIQIPKIQTDDAVDSRITKLNRSQSHSFETDSRSCERNSSRVGFEDGKFRLRQSKSEELPLDTSEHELNGEPTLKRMIPECCIKVWAAEMTLALEKLHLLGFTYGDLDMRNILLGENGHILLSFTSQWSEVDQVPLWGEFSAPEARNSFKTSVWKLHSSADWWSLGAILFVLLTGQSVAAAHPEGFHAQTVLKIPEKNICGGHISTSAKTLLTELLNFSPELRLGYYGSEEIKSHPFFEGFNWEDALASSTRQK